MDPDCIHSLHTTLAIDLHPSKLRDVLGSVREQLDGLLLQYRADLSGVVLTYSDETILSKTAQIHGFFPYFHITVSAKLLVFKLREGQSLVGTVNKVGPDFIGLLVLGVFNAVVKKDNMPASFQHDAQARCWSAADGRHVIQEHSEVLFTLSGVEVFDSHFGIQGHLRGKGNGAADFVCSARKKAKHGTEEGDPSLAAAAAVDGSKISKKAKRKAAAALAAVAPELQGDAKKASKRADARQAPASAAGRKAAPAALDPAPEVVSPPKKKHKADRAAEAAQVAAAPGTEPAPEVVSPPKKKHKADRAAEAGQVSAAPSTEPAPEPAPEPAQARSQKKKARQAAADAQSAPGAQSERSESLRTPHNEAAEQPPAGAVPRTSKSRKKRDVAASEAGSAAPGLAAAEELSDLPKKQKKQKKNRDSASHADGANGVVHGALAKAVDAAASAPECKAAGKRKREPEQNSEKPDAPKVKKKKKK